MQAMGERWPRRIWVCGAIVAAITGAALSCKRRSERRPGRLRTKAPFVSSKTSRPRLPRPVDLPTARQAVALLVELPRELGRKAREIATELDRSLRYPGTVASRVEKFLRYQSGCHDIVARYRALIDEVTPRLAKHRLALESTRLRLGEIPAADRAAFWRWLATFRIWIEDETDEQSRSLVKVAKAFRGRCRREARAIGKLSRIIDKTSFRRRVDLHDLFASGGARAAPPKTPPRRVEGLPPPPRGISAESRARCLLFSAGMGALLDSLRTLLVLIKRSTAHCSGELSRKLVSIKPRWGRELRELERSFVALLRAPSQDQARISRWHEKLGRQVRRRVIPLIKSMGIRLLRFFKRCPQQMKHLASQRLGLIGLGDSLQQVLIQKQKRGKTRLTWRWLSLDAARRQLPKKR